eukprot:363197-Chlamydomonas_euryale.AAC.3
MQIAAYAAHADCSLRSACRLQRTQRMQIAAHVAHAESSPCSASVTRTSQLGGRQRSKCKALHVRLSLSLFFLPPNQMQEPRPAPTRAHHVACDREAPGRKGRVVQRHLDARRAREALLQQPLQLRDRVGRQPPAHHAAADVMQLDRDAVLQQRRHVRRRARPAGLRRRRPRCRRIGTGKQRVGLCVVRLSNAGVCAR